MKYLLVKALLGFGDRLEYLAMCVEFCKQYNIKLRVDWSDSVWGESFYKYFSLDIPSFEMDELTEEKSVYPAYWKGKLNEQLTSETYSADLELNQLKFFDEDIVVAVSGGYRKLYPDYTFFGLKIIHPRIVDTVKQRQHLYDLKNKWCIHLRGTDRFKTKEFREKRYQQLYLKLMHRGLFNQGKCIVLTDDADYAKLWRARDSVSPILSKLYNVGTTGLHYSKPEDIGTTKEELNIQLLIDFFTMASCKQIFSTSMDSRFAKMAGNLKWMSVCMV